MRYYEITIIFRATRILNADLIAKNNINLLT